MSVRGPGPIALAMTGASGAQYGLRLLQCLLTAGRNVQLVISKPAQLVIGTETDEKLPGRPQEIERHLAEAHRTRPGQLRVFGPEEWTAPLASGSNPPEAMAVCPCSMATVAGIAQGSSRNLIERAADVVLKERRTLILVPRETPLSIIHLENLTRLARAGALVLPANPGFYHRPQSLAEVVDFVVARVLDHLGVEQSLIKRWGEEAAEG
ncbi:MAG TPA: flavin prenyltransferase UbiX [Steroidobacteraceae bacterium]|jgi:4-hydroxy-3-polyprenylbenzoate decarboxylase|nr:flavin prenyltransferase UbiX [Steroidobacteraceae bacterium]